MKCDICGGEFKNLGVHKRFCGTSAKEPVDLLVDEVLQIPLSVIVLAIKDLLRQFQNSMEIKISEQNGKPIEVQIITVIKL